MTIVETVLFVGVGRMGAPMALRLADHGVDLSVADLSKQALEPFRTRGLPTGASGDDLPGDVVITMLPSEAHVRAALLDEGGACRERPRRLVIDMSSVSPASTRALGADLAERGTALLDSPVSGGLVGAKAGTLTAMVGGDPAVLSRYAGLIGLMCSDVTHVGPTGAGHVAKALNNYLSAASLWSASEALLIGTRLGLDAKTMLEIWTRGSGRSHATEVKLPQHVLPRSFDFGQSLELFCKDVDIATSLAALTDVATPTLDAIAENWRWARDQLGGQADITTVTLLLERQTRR